MNTKLNNDLFLEEVEGGHLGFFTKVETKTTLTVPIDQDFREPSYYRHVVAAIKELTEDDIVVFEINSSGGRVDGLVALLSAIERTPAISIAVLNGMAASAASILALNCDVCLMTENAGMMCHNASFMSAGKAYDIQSHVSYEKRRNEELMRKTYKYFLEEDEIEELLKGIEFWFDAQEIQNRLNIREDIRELEANAEGEEELLEEAEVEEVVEKPKRNTKSKYE